MVSEFEQALSAIVVCFVMLGLGASLTLGDFGRVLRQPHGVAIGLACANSGVENGTFSSVPLSSNQRKKR